MYHYFHVQFKWIGHSHPDNCAEEDRNLIFIVRVYTDCNIKYAEEAAIGKLFGFFPKIVRGDFEIRAATIHDFASDCTFMDDILALKLE